MKNIIGYLKNLSGKFFAKDEQAHVREIFPADPVYEGEIVVDVSGKEIVEALHVSCEEKDEIFRLDTLTTGTEVEEVRSTTSTDVIDSVDRGLEVTSSLTNQVDTVIPLGEYFFDTFKHENFDRLSSNNNLLRATHFEERGEETLSDAPFVSSTPLATSISISGSIPIPTNTPVESEIPNRSIPTISSQTSIHSVDGLEEVVASVEQTDSDMPIGDHTLNTQEENINPVVATEITQEENIDPALATQALKPTEDIGNEEEANGGGGGVQYLQIMHP